MSRGEPAAASTGRPAISRAVLLAVVTGRSSIPAGPVIRRTAPASATALSASVVRTSSWVTPAAGSIRSSGPVRKPGTEAIDRGSVWTTFWLRPEPRSSFSSGSTVRAPGCDIAQLSPRRYCYYPIAGGSVRPRRNIVKSRRHRPSATAACRPPDGKSDDHRNRPHQSRSQVDSAMRNAACRHRGRLAGLLGFGRMGPRCDRRSHRLRGSRDGSDRTHHGRARTSQHADADSVQGLFEEGPRAGVGHGSRVTSPAGNDVEKRGWPASAHEARRFILHQLPRCTAVEAAGSEERRVRAEEPPVLLEPDMIEGSAFRAVHVADPSSVRGQSGFAAFLDGTQDVRIVNQIDGIPIVWATVSAAVRERVNRRLVSWSGAAPLVRGGYYIPFRYVDGLRDDLRQNPRVIDTARADASGIFPSRHPAALMESALQRIQNERERAETELAESWCRREDRAVYVDGSITASAEVAASPLAVGIIKSHRRLYAEGGAFRILVGLGPGERSTIFSVAPRSRHPVASWYVRVRSAAGRDALFGLVRVEAALGGDISARADEISRWIIAEGAPLALPDGRWDKMAYGIRDTEEFLRAIS